MPSLIACKTHIAFGAPTKVGHKSSHGAALGAPEVEGCRKNFKWESEAFVVPEEIEKRWKAIP